MTSNQTPADPSAYRVTLTRNGHGTLTHIEVFRPGSAPKPEFWTYHPEDVDRLLALAREEEDSDPHSDRLPSDRAIICAVLRAQGIPILGEQEEDTSHERDTFVPRPESDESWRSVVITLANDTLDVWTGPAGEAFDNNDDEPLKGLIRDVARGEHDEARFGGGATPECIIRRAPRELRDGPLDGRGTGMVAAFDALAEANAAELAEADADYEALAAERDALLALVREASAPGGIGPHEFYRPGGWRERALAAIAKAEGR